MPWTARELAGMNQQQLMTAIAEMTEAELREAIKAPINSVQQAIILDRLASVEAAKDAKTSRYQARLAIAIALVALAISLAAWLGLSPLR